MPNAYPSEFRRDVVTVAMNREPGVTLEKIAADFGIHPITLSTWLKRASVEDGVRPGIRSAESADLREANKRIRLLASRSRSVETCPGLCVAGQYPGKR